MRKKKISIDDMMKLIKRPRPVWALLNPVQFGEVSIDEMSKLLDARLIRLPTEDEVQAYMDFFSGKKSIGKEG